MGVRRSPQVIGRYAIYGRIASGGMASVHFGRLLGAAGFSRTVAIKRLHPHLAEDPDFLSTLIDEARLVARISHPNVVPTLDVVSTEGELLVVMEYVRGESLARLVRAEAERGRAVPPAVASAIVVGALRGLHAAHEAVDDGGAPLGIVHRDVSPQNLLVGTDGVTRVIDFGIAKAAGRLQTTRDGVLKGKLEYMAPEQLLRGPAVTRRVDVYATAAVLWEALVGAPCFQGHGDGETYGLILAGAVEPPSRHNPGLPPCLDAVVMRGLSTDPGHRFATARDMADALLRVLPPAFPTDVGAWVERAARESLAKRAATVADIERDGVGTDPNGSTFEWIEPADVDEPPVASQPSSLSVETPKRVLVASVPPAGSKLSAGLAAGMAAGGVVVGGIAMLLLRGPPVRADGTHASGASAAWVVAVSAPLPSASVPPVAPSASSSAVSLGEFDASASARPAPHERPHRAPSATAPSPPDWPLSHDRH